MWDFILLAFVNGLRAFIERSASKKRESTATWDRALVQSIMAHRMFREAALQDENGTGDPVALAFNLLKEAIRSSPTIHTPSKRFYGESVTRAGIKSYRRG